MIKKGFTLVELLVVMAILGVLVTLVAGGFRTAQMRGRDGQRKSDLKQIANSLELYFSDYGEYPDASGGIILGCPTTSSSSCSWGTGEFTDGKTSYFRILPADPTKTQNYFYRVPDSPSNQKFQLYARLENSQDQDCLEGNCLNPAVPAGVLCGGNCNFSVTSPNTTANE